MSSMLTAKRAKFLKLDSLLDILLILRGRVVAPLASRAFQLDDVLHDDVRSPIPAILSRKLCPKSGLPSTEFRVATV